ncbi:hypothetical protein ACFVTC_19915 [Streptomyces sp. NPDC057950]|uniref:hypothetical protein n=1 Tax=Streptomyces sp. NPDC057950 TaxID=3346288 RepID=UPI0036E57FCE
MRQQTVPQGDRDRVFAGVAAGVVHAQRRTRHQLPGEQHVVLVERDGVPRPYETGRSSSRRRTA